MTNSKICVLRPLTIHNGEYVRADNGYRKKDSIFELSWSRKSVVEKIDEITDAQSRRRCINAYNYLMNETGSSYKKFVNKTDKLTNTSVRFNVYDAAQNRYVECCLWPHLYPTREFCESGIDGDTSRRSRKISFMHKVLSTIVDYATMYDLLHFHYDICRFKTVSGALTSGRFHMCSPARSLEAKPFSIEYWKWQHRFLLDAVNQFGTSSIFLTTNGLFLFPFGFLV